MLLNRYSVEWRERSSTIATTPHPRRRNKPLIATMQIEIVILQSTQKEPGRKYGAKSAFQVCLQRGTTVKTPCIRTPTDSQLSLTILSLNYTIYVCPGASSSGRSLSFRTTVGLIHFGRRSLLLGPQVWLRQNARRR